MSFIEGLKNNPYKNGLSAVQFYIGLVLIVLLPLIEKTPSLLTSDRIEVTAVGVSNQGAGRQSVFFNVPKNYMVWKGVSPSGVLIEFTGTRNNLFEKGEVRTAVYSNRPFILSFAGIYNHLTTSIVLILLVLWSSLFFVYGQSEKQNVKVREISGRIYKVLAYVGVVFALIFVTLIPFVIYILKGSWALVSYLLIVLIISSWLKESIMFLIFSESKLKAIEMKKAIKKRDGARQAAKEIYDRRQKKKKS